MTALRVLFVTRVYPYPDHAGDLKYTAGLIEALAASDGIDLTVLCGSGLSDDAPAPRTISGGTRWVGLGPTQMRRADIRSLLGSYPRAAERGFPAEASQLLRDLLDRERCDIAILNEAVTARAAQILAAAKVPMVYISHNVDADIRPAIAARVRNPFLRRLQQIDAAKYRTMELELLKKIVGLTAITHEDLDRYGDLGCAAPRILLTPGRPAPPATPPFPMAARKPVAVLVGSFEWNAKIANLEMILAAYARYVRARPARPFGLRIAGRAAPGLFMRLSKTYPEVEFHGSFDDLADVVADARIALNLEDMGGGFKLKTLDYIFCELTIVGFPRAMSGSDLEAGTDYLAVTSLDESMCSIAALIEDFPRLTAMSQSAYAKARCAYDWSDRAVRLTALLRAICDKRT